MAAYSRRDFLRLASQGAVLSAFGPGLLSAGAAPAGAKRMSVLFIAVDDLRPQLGCYGNRQVISPNIDGLAARGTVFDHAYCQQALCSPSRTSILTGCRPDTTRVYELETHFRANLPEVVTLPQHFKANGYHTQGLGKIYHGGLDDAPSWSVPHWTPRRPMYLLPENRQIVARKTADVEQLNLKGLARFNRTLGPPYESADVADNAYADGATADEAIRVLGETRDRPFFLGVGFLKPHLPFIAPKRYWDLYQREKIDLADNPFAPRDAPAIALTNWSELRAYEGMPKDGPLSEDAARTLVHGYLACVSYTDAQIGRVLDELKRLGLAENTVVILWGDHGWKLGEHGMWCKHTNFELDAHAPMLCAVPGQRAAGRHSGALTEFVDIYPTLCDACGLEKPGHLEGTSFVPLLDRPDRPWKSAAFSQYPRGRVMGYSMRTERYRFTRWQERDGSAVAVELYDHERDPKENVNIAGLPESAPLVEKLTAQLQAGWKAARPA